MKTTIEFPENIITTQINRSKVATIATLIIVSAILIISTNFVDYDTHSTTSTIMISCAIAGIIASAIMSMSLKHAVLAKSNSPLVCKTIDFNESKHIEIAVVAAENRWSEIPSIAKDSSGVSMKIEVVYSKDKSFGAYQIFKYVPHSYEPCSEIIYISGDNIAKASLS